MVESDLALKHETRRLIYNHIVAHPGVSFNTLKEVYDLTDGTLRYHLGYLKRAEKIQRSLEEGNRCYYPCSTGNVENRLIKGNPEVIKLSIAQEKMVTIIKQKPGINQKDLSRECNMNRFIVRNNLQQLMNFGIIKKVQVRNTVCYEYITDGHMHYEILKKLVIKLLNGEITEKQFLELKNKIE